jgi:hypothetical protein
VIGMTELKCVVADVRLEPRDPLIAEMRKEHREKMEREVGAAHFEDNRLRLHTWLSAELDDGHTVGEGSGPDHGHVGLLSATNIHESVDQMLGRDPTLHRPPRLSWGGLIERLRGAGIPANEDSLIGLPIRVAIAPEVRARLVPHEPRFAAARVSIE